MHRSIQPSINPFNHLFSRHHPVWQGAGAHPSHLGIAGSLPFGLSGEAGRAAAGEDVRGLGKNTGRVWHGEALGSEVEAPRYEAAAVIKGYDSH